MARLRSDSRYTMTIIRSCIPIHDGATAYEIVVSSGYHIWTVREVLKELRAARRAYIVGWRVPVDEYGVRSGRTVALYARGKGTDAPRPGFIGEGERKRNYKDRQKRKREVNAFNRIVL